MTGSDLCVMDSSGWVEYLGNGPKADFFAPFLEREESLLVPTIVIYEVSKKLILSANEMARQRFLSVVFRANDVPLTTDLAIEAARISLQHRLAMADAIIYAAAQTHEAQLVTGDIHFQGLPGVVIA